MLFNFDRSRRSRHDTCPDRRRFLQFGAAATTTLLLPKAFASVRLPEDIPTAPERKLSLINLHTGESLTATYWAEGQYQSSELAAIDYLLRDHRTGDIHTMDSNLLELLNRLHDKVDTKKPFQVISGFRSAKTNAALRKKSDGVAKKSLHMQGKAIDISLPDCGLSDLRKAALACRAGGVGYYPKSNFVHIDTGRVRHWG
ncbi:MAG TPA: DUF882 domain-containing protein [Gammaproteobacteria bacterium]|nr:DUF882 domain-containing protein [Gammaproteobacteria bacterium]